MNMGKVVNGLRCLIEEKGDLKLPVPGRCTDRDHLLWMLDQIDSGKITDEKAHRWIGYVQGVVVMCRMTEVEDMRDLNR